MLAKIGKRHGKLGSRILPIMLEIDGRSGCIKFKALKSAERLMLLGMEFERVFVIEAEWEPEQWRSRGGLWHEFIKPEVEPTQESPWRVCGVEHARKIAASQSRSSGGRSIGETAGWTQYINYWDINGRTVKNAHSVASMEAILDKLCGAKYISNIDLKNAYLQVPMAPQSKKYAAFSVLGKDLFTIF